MAVKLRLSRDGRRKVPYYSIVIADSRSPRDGKYIEQIGIYNPQTIPATIEIDSDKALKWLEKGAQPTETLYAILKYKGILYKKHLLNGVKKGILTIEQVNEKFKTWEEPNNNKIIAKRESVIKAGEEKRKMRHLEERKINEKIAARNMAKNSELAKLAEPVKQVEQTTEAPIEVKTEDQTAQN